MAWRDMATAPLNGELVDLRFGGVRYIDCFFTGGRWRRTHGWPSTTTVFHTWPDGWLPRPDDLVRPYETDATGRKCVP